MKFLFQYDVILISVRRIPMMLKVIFNHFVRYITCTPGAVTNCPKVFSPITLRQFRVFFLQSTGSSSFQSLDQVAHRRRWPIFDVHMNMIFAYNSFKDSNVFSITNLLNQISATALDISFKNWISVFCYPNYMCGQPTYRMPANPLIFTHEVKLGNV